MVIRFLAVALLLALPAHAAVTIDAVAAGDPTETDVILWTRATDNEGPAKVTARVATDPGFRRVVWTGSQSTDAEDDFTLKLNPTGLRPGTRYYYQFAAGNEIVSGRFKTATRQNVPVTFGFSGDADGRFRPYPSIANISRHNLDFFIFLGDTMYESASGNPPTASPAVPRVTAESDAEEATKGLAAYHRKYLENISGVTETGTTARAGQRSLVPLFAAAGHYTLLDNHELGGWQLQSGGAPRELLSGDNPVTKRTLDANTTNTFHNQTLGFQTLEKAYFDYHPTRISIRGTPASGLTITGPRVEAPSDPRGHGTAKQYFTQRWGKHSLYIQVDDRSYRDVRLSIAKGDDEAALPERAANPNRTILGATQMAWLKETLLRAKRDGITWKFVVISSPIDMVGGVPGGQQQDQKSWYGGFRAERNMLLDFIATNAIDHVVFLATDDHMARMTRLQYERADGTKALVPGAFHIVAGPIGATGPDRFLEHSPEALMAKIGPRTASQTAMGQPPDGLGGLPGLRRVWRDIDSQADKRRQPIDFLSPDTFNYAVLNVDTSGTLSVSVYGIPSYQPNQNFTKPAEREHKIMSFQVQPR